MVPLVIGGVIGRQFGSGDGRDAMTVVGTLVGAAIGAAIDGRYDGTILPMAIAAVVVGLVVVALTRWSDAVWERDAERESITPEEQSQAEAAAPLEVG